MKIEPLDPSLALQQSEDEGIPLFITITDMGYDLGGNFSKNN